MMRLAAALLLAAGCWGLGYGPEQSDFWWIIGLYAPFFAVYWWVCRRDLGASGFRFFWWVGLILRAGLLFSAPNLSDDVYRFIWDGRLLQAGFNPFAHLPAYYLEAGNEIPGLTPDLFRQLNSPEYFTIYPPVAQGSFWLATALFPQNLEGSIFVLKFLLLGAEVGNLLLLPRLLQHWRLPGQRSLWYVLNPLIIIEICGNLHYEGAMIFFLLLAYWWLLQQRLTFSAAAMGLSVATKLLPLMFLPLLIRRLGWRRSFFYFAVSGGVVLLLFAPLLGGPLVQHFGESLDLYFRKFEFNASIYYLFRWWGYQTEGRNLIALIGPRLALVTLGGILALTLFEGRPDWRRLPRSMLWAIVLYLLFTTTVHPWYLSLPVVLCLFTPYRFPILWSGLIFLTYINYSYPEYYENLWVVALEYTAVGLMALWELGTAARRVNGKTEG